MNIRRINMLLYIIKNSENTELRSEAYERLNDIVNSMEIPVLPKKAMKMVNRPNEFENMYPHPYKF
jgi:hypothetical protein